MRGRKPQTVASDGKALDEVPQPPSWLSKDAKAEWQRVAPILITERRTLTLGDMAGFANYCCAVGQASEAQRIINKEGLVTQAKTGLRKHPAVAILHDAMTQARLYAAELGLTPVSRSRPSVRDDQDDEDTSALGL